MSAYYQERMEADLREIRAKVREVSDLVERQVDDAVRALFDDDRDLAARVVMGDREVNRRIRDIDRLCHAFIVRHAPDEDFLRRTSAVLRLDVALERVGDYADSIGREVGRLGSRPTEAVARDMQAIAQLARRSLEESLRAFHDMDEGLARSAGASDPDSARFEEVLTTLLGAGDDGEYPVDDLFGFLHVINLLMRILEQAENIREQTLFALSGETPPPKVFRVHFVDVQNARASQMAEAYARKAFPSSGVYTSGGWQPASEVSAELVGYLGSQGLEASDLRPKAATHLDEAGRHHNVIVSMSPDGRERLGLLPYRTTLVTWDLPGSATADFDGLYGAVKHRVDELMLTLAGPNAA